VQFLTIFASVTWLLNAYLDLYFVDRLAVRDSRKYGERTRPGWTIGGIIFLFAATFALVAAFYDSYVLLEISVYIAILGFIAPWAHRRFLLKDRDEGR